MSKRVVAWLVMSIILVGAIAGVAAPVVHMATSKNAKPPFTQTSNLPPAQNQQHNNNDSDKQTEEPTRIYATLNDELGFHIFFVDTEINMTSEDIIFAAKYFYVYPFESLDNHFRIRYGEFGTNRLPPEISFVYNEKQYILVTYYGDN